MKSEIIVSNKEWDEYVARAQEGLEPAWATGSLMEQLSRYWKWIAVAGAILLLLILLPKSKEEKNASAEAAQKIREQRIEAEGRAELDGRQILDEEAVAKLIGEENLLGKEVAPPASAEASIIQPARTELAGPMVVFVQGEGSDFGSLGIPMGTEIRATIHQSIVSSDLEVPVIAIIQQDFLKDGKVVIPKRSKLLGKSSILQTENRLNIHFYRLVTPDQKEIPFSGIALMPDGSAGLVGKLHRKPGSRGGSIAAAAALGASGAFMPQGNSFGNAFARGAHSGAVSETGRDLDHYRQTEGNPTIEIPSNQEVIVFVDRSI